MAAMFSIRGFGFRYSDAPRPAVCDGGFIDPPYSLATSLVFPSPAGAKLNWIVFILVISSML